MTRTYPCQVAGGTIYINTIGQGPLVLVLGGISGDRDAVKEHGKGWWQGLAEGVSPSRYTLVMADYAGGSGDSEVENLPVTIAEQAIYIADALKQLQLVNFHAVVGGSYGGLVALELAQHKHLAIARVAIIGAAHRPTAQAVMLRTLQREFVRLGDAAKQPERGVQMARAMAMLSYRSAEGMDQYYPNPEDAVAYIESRGLRTVQRSLSRARQLFEIFGPALDSYRVAPELIKQPILLIGFDSDQLVPPSVIHEFATQLPACRGCHVMSSSYGHDGFIKNAADYAGILSEFLESPCR